LKGKKMLKIVKFDYFERFKASAGDALNKTLIDNLKPLLIVVITCQIYLLSASHSISNNLSKSGRAKTSTIHIVSFDHLKTPLSFLTPMELPLLQTLCDGSNYAAEILDKPPIECCQSMKTPHFTNRLRSRPLLDSPYLLFIHPNSISAYHQKKSGLSRETALL